MTEPRSGDSAPESQRFPLPPFMPPAPRTALTPAPPLPSPGAVLPPFSAPQPPAPAFPTEPPPLPWETAAEPLAPEAPERVSAPLVDDDEDAMPWEMILPDEPSAAAWVETETGAVETGAQAAAGELPWLALDDLEEEPVALAELAPTADEAQIANEAEGAEEAPAWLSWIGGEDEPESEPVSAELDLVEIGDLGALSPPEQVETLPPVAEAVAPAEVALEPAAPAEFAAAEPAVAAEGTPFGALAERLERLAAELRSESPAALLAGVGRDPLEVLILGYALGQLHGSGERGTGR